MKCIDILKSLFHLTTNIFQKHKALPVINNSFFLYKLHSILIKHNNMKNPLQDYLHKIAERKNRRSYDNFKDELQTCAPSSR